MMTLMLQLPIFQWMWRKAYCNFCPFRFELMMSASIKPRPSSVVPGFQADASPPPGMSISDRDDFKWLPRVKNAQLRFVSFPGAQENSKSASENFQVPSITPYVTGGMDMDAVHTLSALYITHTVGLIEAIRYVKMKQVVSFKFSANCSS
jgi:hypothetical protein